MASKKYLSVSRSVACSLAALLLLSGAMFLVTTFQEDSEEWVLVEDQVFDFAGVTTTNSAIGVDSSTVDSCEFVFDEDTGEYALTVPDSIAHASSWGYDIYGFAPVDDFDYSKNYKIVFGSEIQIYDFGYSSSTSAIFNLRVSADEETGIYNASVILLDQKVTDLSFQDYFWLSFKGDSASSYTFANDFTMYVYELQTDNTGSVAAGVTGLVMILMGVLALPSVNILRRR